MDKTTQEFKRLLEFSMKRLRSAAKGKSIKNYSKLTKAELVMALRPDLTEVVDTKLVKSTQPASLVKANKAKKATKAVRNRIVMAHNPRLKEYIVDLVAANLSTNVNFNVRHSRIVLAFADPEYPEDIAFVKEKYFRTNQWFRTHFHMPGSNYEIARVRLNTMWEYDTIELLGLDFQHAGFDLEERANGPYEFTRVAHNKIENCVMNIFRNYSDKLTKPKERTVYSRFPFLMPQPIPVDGEERQPIYITPAVLGNLARFLDITLSTFTALGVITEKPWEVFGFGNRKHLSVKFQNEHATLMAAGPITKVVYLDHIPLDVLSRTDITSSKCVMTKPRTYPKKAAAATKVSDKKPWQCVDGKWAPAVEPPRAPVMIWKEVRVGVWVQKEKQEPVVRKPIVPPTFVPQPISVDYYVVLGETMYKKYRPQHIKNILPNDRVLSAVETAHIHTDNAYYNKLFRLKYNLTCIRDPVIRGIVKASETFIGMRQLVELDPGALIFEADARKCYVSYETNPSYIGFPTNNLLITNYVPDMTFSFAVITNVLFTAVASSAIEQSYTSFYGLPQAGGVTVITYPTYKYLVDNGTEVTVDYVLVNTDEFQHISVVDFSVQLYEAVNTLSTDDIKMFRNQLIGSTIQGGIKGDRKVSLTYSSEAERDQMIYECQRDDFDYNVDEPGIIRVVIKSKANGLFNFHSYILAYAAISMMREWQALADKKLEVVGYVVDALMFRPLFGHDAIPETAVNDIHNVDVEITDDDGTTWVKTVPMHHCPDLITRKLVMVEEEITTHDGRKKMKSFLRVQEGVPANNQYNDTVSQYQPCPLTDILKAVGGFTYSTVKPYYVNLSLQVPIIRHDIFTSTRVRDNAPITLHERDTSNHIGIQGAGGIGKTYPYISHPSHDQIVLVPRHTLRLEHLALAERLGKPVAVNTVHKYVQFGMNDNEWLANRANHNSLKRYARVVIDEAMMFSKKEWITMWRRIVTIDKSIITFTCDPEQICNSIESDPVTLDWFKKRGVIMTGIQRTPEMIYARHNFQYGSLLDTMRGASLESQQNIVMTGGWAIEDPVAALKKFDRVNDRIICGDHVTVKYFNDMLRDDEVIAVRDQDGVVSNVSPTDKAIWWTRMRMCDIMPAGKKYAPCFAGTIDSFQGVTFEYEVGVHVQSLTRAGTLYTAMTRTRLQAKTIILGGC